jgi:uncharacterized protein
MAATPRFSHRPNRAHEIAWHPWGAEAFALAGRTDRLVYLNITVGWCEACNVMDETTLSDPAVTALLADRMVPIRVDADRLPHVQDRYIAGGWPTSAILTPTGELLWSATFVDAATLLATAGQALDAWQERRAELEVEMERRRRALEAARGRQASFGMVRREAADDVISVARESIDPRNGGFGDAPKFPAPAAVELMYLRGARGEPDRSSLRAPTLDGMLAGELWDPIDGGFYRYALEADWTAPRMEKLLEVNAGLLRAYALGAQLRGRGNWAVIAERTVEWVEATLRLDDGLWAGSQLADDAWFGASAEARATSTPPGTDGTVFTHANARWIAALAEAGGRLGRTTWIDRAAAALDRLLESMSADGDLMYHFRAAGEPAIPFLLADTLHTGIAALAVAQATGRADHLNHARRLAAGMERAFWAEDGGFNDRSRNADDLGLLRYRDRPFELNAEAARFYCDLSGATGERGLRGCAERVLALLSPAAGRYGVAAAAFAIAADEYFEPPCRTFIVLPGSDDALTASAALRAAALAAPRADHRVYTVPSGSRIGPLDLAAAGAPAAFICQRGACSPPLTDPGPLTDALARTR